ncbi:MAG TPA: hypothetical protein VLV89_00650 [Candidatus Acidoferrum sp.]|nr:hypothetical protein [Candidatus Acidoferrum sp.]
MKPQMKATFPTTFGVFSPTEHVVMVFATEDEAERARGLLIRNGFKEEDVVHYPKDEVLAELKKKRKAVCEPAADGPGG